MNSHTTSPLAVNCFNDVSKSVILTGLNPGQYEVRLGLWWIPGHASVTKPVRSRFNVTSSAESRNNVEKGEQAKSPSSAVLPLCFVTIVLNGMPFLRHHATAFAEAAMALNTTWTWDVVEGTAVGRANVARPYSRSTLTDVRRNGCSTDGTHEYLNTLEAQGCRPIYF